MTNLERLFLLVESAGISYADLAKEMGTTTRTLMLWKSDPTKKTWPRVYNSAWDSAVRLVIRRRDCMTDALKKLDVDLERELIKAEVRNEG